MGAVKSSTMRTDDLIIRTGPLTTANNWLALTHMTPTQSSCATMPSQILLFNSSCCNRRLHRYSSLQQLDCSSRPWTLMSRQVSAPRHFALSLPCLALPCLALPLFTDLKNFYRLRQSKCDSFQATFCFVLFFSQ